MISSAGEEGGGAYLARPDNSGVVLRNHDASGALELGESMNPQPCMYHHRVHDWQVYMQKAVVLDVMPRQPFPSPPLKKRSEKCHEENGNTASASR